jgi:hypothetical protein
MLDDKEGDAEPDPHSSPLPQSYSIAERVSTPQNFEVA